ncbi:MAG: MATE family efflux transporter [Spirochaetaceae bacterium]|nr:MATE family efflux transporter [Spirochaetaceae bacterium]
MKTPLLGDRHFYRHTLTLGLPVALQHLLTTSAGFVDTIMIGSQGELAVAAVGICSQYTMLLFSAYFGFCNGGTIFIAQYWGAKNERGICSSYGLMLSCMMAVGLLFGSAAVFAPEFILGIYTDKENIRQAGIPYLRIVGFSYPLQVFSMAIGSLLRSVERVKTPLFASVLSLFSNTFLNWVLIFGRFGFPCLGVSGAAIATVCAALINVLVLYLWCFRDRTSFVLRIRDHYRWHRNFLGQFFSKNLFIVGNEVFYGLGQMLINIVIGRQIESGIAAIAVFRVIEGIIFTFFNGLANASAVMVGKKIGAGEHLDGYRYAKRFIVLSPALTLLICVLILPVRGSLLSLFGLGDAARRYAMGMLLIYTITGTIRSCNYMNNNIFRAGGESVFGTVIELGGLFFISVPAVALTGMVLHLPFLIVFTMLYLDEFIRLGIIVWYMNSGKWIKPVTEEGRKTLGAFRSRRQD